MRTEALVFLMASVGAGIWIAAAPPRCGAGWGPAGCAPPMFGRAPTMPMVFPPSFPPQGAMQSFPPAQTMGPASWQPTPGPMSFPHESPERPLAHVPAPGPVVRGQADDEPAIPESAPLPEPAVPVAVSLPAPEQLGIGAPADPGAVDWAVTHSRLDRLGATCIHLEKLARGGCRFSCLIPTSVANRSRRVEAQAATEAEAVRLALEKAEDWAAAAK